jgi:hypothetical protein
MPSQQMATFCTDFERIIKISSLTHSEEHSGIVAMEEKTKKESSQTEESADSEQNLATALELLSKPFIAIAPIAALMTAYAYILGDRYYTGFYGTLGISWAADGISLLDKANSASAPLILVALFTGIFIFLYRNGAASFHRILASHLWLTAACAATWALHLTVQYWLGYESYWHYFGYFLIIILAATTAAIGVISVAENPKERFNALYFTVISLGLAAAPTGAKIFGEAQGKEFLGNGYLYKAYAVIDEKDRCSWRVVQWLSPEKLLIAKPDKPFLYKTANPDSIIEFLPKDHQKCSSASGTTAR